MTSLTYQLCFCSLDRLSKQKQADVNSLLLLLGLLCHLLPLLFRYGGSGGPGAASIADYTLQLSRASSIVMLLAYVAYIFFQLKTHRQLFESQEVTPNKHSVPLEGATIVWYRFL